MPALQGSVCLTSSAPFPIEPNQLILYDVIDASTVCRSGVLSCIVEAGGEATLPDTVTLPDFKAYVRAVSYTGEKFRRLPFESMCTVMKVADALDDVHVTEWIQLAGRSLLRSVPIAAQYLRLLHDDTLLIKDSDIPLDGWQLHNIHEELTHLPQHLLLRILTEVTNHPKGRLICLQHLPSDLHTAVLAAAINPKKALTIQLPMQHVNSELMAALESFPASSGLLTCLNVRLQASLTNEDMHNAFSSLATVLTRLTGLTAFHLAEPRAAAVSEPVIQSLAKLTSIQTLTLASDIHPLHPGKLSNALSIFKTLRSLSSLQDLRLHLQRPGQLKRPHDTTGTPHSCIDQLLRATSGLRYLYIKLANDRSSEYFTVSGPISLPELRSLDISDSFMFAPQFLEHLQPNDHFSSLHLGAQVQPLPPGRGAGAVRKLMRHLADLTWLRRLQIALPIDNTVDGVAVRDAVVQGAPEALGVMPLLEDLDVHGAIAAIAHVVAPVIDGAVDLTRLCLTFKCHERLAPLPEGTRRTADALENAAHWTRITLELARCTQLRHLEVMAADYILGACGLSVLAPLVQLSALVVRAWRCLRGAEDCVALAAMTGLRQLHLGSCRGAAVTPSTALAALLPLDMLIHLRLNDGAMLELLPAALGVAAALPLWPEGTDGAGAVVDASWRSHSESLSGSLERGRGRVEMVPSALRAAAAAAAARAPWPELQTLRLTAPDILVKGEVEAAVRAAAAALPALRALCLDFRQVKPFTLRDVLPGAAPLERLRGVAREVNRRIKVDAVMPEDICTSLSRCAVAPGTAL